MKRVLCSSNRILLCKLLLSFFIAGWAAGACADPIGVDESAIRSPGEFTGPLPLITTAFAYELPDKTLDVLPMGPDQVRSLYLFCLFDTGATSVALSATDSALLGLSSLPISLDVRVNGIGAINANTLGAPIGPPVFSPSQAQVTETIVGSTTKKVSLIGAPVANRTVAYIDYRQETQIQRGPYAQVMDDPKTSADERYVVGPDIRFFPAFGFPGLHAINKMAEVVLTLERFGALGFTKEGAHKGQRYYLRNISFEDRSHRVSDQGGVNLDIFWDSGSNFTSISQTMAQTLGLFDRERDFTCRISESIDLAGYEIDSVVMTGWDRGRYGVSYTVENARVCVDNSAVPFGGVADARIGSNLFDQVPILFHGPDNTLTILSDAESGASDDVIELNPPTLRILSTP